MRRRGTTAQRGSASGARSGAGHRPWIWSHLNVILPVPREHLRSRTRHGTSHRVARHGQHICPAVPEHCVSFQGWPTKLESLPFLPPEDRALLVKSRRRCRPSLKGERGNLFEFSSARQPMTGVSLLRRAAVGTLAGVLAYRYTTELAGASGSVKTAAVTLNTGARMPALGFGTYLLTGDACRSAVLAALRAGYRHIDTAAGYLNEAQVAEALEESGLRREEVFIASKLWSDSHGTEATRRAIRTPHRAPTPDQLTGSPGRSATHTRVQCLPCLGNTLKRLRTPYLDLYLIHAPDNQGHTAAETIELRRQSWVVMEEEHRKGTLRAIGVCNFEARHIDQLLRWGEVTPAVNQVYSRSAHTTHHLTVSPSHRLSVSPSHRLTRLSATRTCSSASCRPTAPPRYSCTVTLP